MRRMTNTIKKHKKLHFLTGKLNFIISCMRQITSSLYAPPLNDTVFILEKFGQNYRSKHRNSPIYYYIYEVKKRCYLRYMVGLSTEREERGRRKEMLCTTCNSRLQFHGPEKRVNESNKLPKHYTSAYNETVIKP